MSLTPPAVAAAPTYCVERVSIARGDRVAFHPSHARTNSGRATCQATPAIGLKKDAQPSTGNFEELSRPAMRPVLRCIVRCGRTCEGQRSRSRGIGDVGRVERCGKLAFGEFGAGVDVEDKGRVRHGEHIELVVHDKRGNTGPTAPAPQTATRRRGAVGRSPTKTSRVRRSPGCSPSRWTTAGDQPAIGLSLSYDGDIPALP